MITKHISPQFEKYNQLNYELSTAEVKIEELDRKIECAINPNVEADLQEEKNAWVLIKMQCENNLNMLRETMLR